MGFFNKNNNETIIASEIEEPVRQSGNNTINDINEDCLYDVAMDVYGKYTDKVSSNAFKNLQDRDIEALHQTKEKMYKTIKEEMLKNRLFPEHGINRVLTEEEQNKIIDLIDSRQFGYGVLDQFIADPEVSDIKTYSWDNIRIKKNGKRYPAGVTFRDAKDYEDFTNRIMERNGTNFGTANADQTLTDNSQDSARLRISAISGLLTDNELPCFAIRKIPKNKMTVDILDKKGMFEKERHKVSKAINLDDTNTADVNLVPDNEELNKLIPRLVHSGGILFTGKGASGKTSLMNALLELVPHDESIMLCQENPELFMPNHPDCLATHVLVNKGEKVVSYDLGALTRMALLVDLDRIVVGEIKQADEAEGLSKASMTGHKCWASVHGSDCRMAINKTADYISAATGYGIKDSLAQLQGFEYVVHLRNFQIDEIVQICGWDRDKQELILKDVYKVA